MKKQLKTFNTLPYGYLIHTAIAYVLYSLWKVKVIEIHSELGSLLFVRDLK